MSVVVNSSNSQEQSFFHKQHTFEWHITITDDNRLPNKTSTNEQTSEKVTAITALQDYSQQHNQQNNQQTLLSNAEFKKAISKGALWLTPAKNKKQTQRLRRVKKPLNVGDELHFYYNSEVLSAEVPPAQLIEDLIDYSVWYKPYGMLSQGSKWSDHCTIARFAQQNLPNERPAFIVHRLDRAATGLILIAHTKKAARTLSAMFEHHHLEKYYHIVVHGDHSQRPQPEVIVSDVDGKSAQSTFTCLEYDESTDRSLIKVKIEGGRKHQIRIHAASIGLPVVGDRLHGIANENEPLNLQLCAVSLRFTCPLSVSKKTVSDKAISINKAPLAGEESTTLIERFFEVPETVKPQLSPRL